MPAPQQQQRRPTRRRRRILRWGLGLLVFLLVGFGILNWLASRHAHALTHYAPAGTPAPRKPEEMSLGDRLSVVLNGVQVQRPTNDKSPDSFGLTYTSHKLDVVGGGFVALWQIDRPDASGVVVLAPGHGSSKSSMLAEAAAFHRLGWAVILIDFRGTGDSPGNATTFGYREGSEAASALTYAKYSYLDRPVVAYGSGAGAAAILRASSRHLHATPAGMVLEAPFDEWLEVVRQRVQDMDLPSWPTAEMLVYWGGRLHDFDGFAHRPVDYALDIMCPAWVLHGTLNPQATPAMASRVYDQLLGSKKRIPFDGAGHEPLIRFDPAKWEVEMAGFLTEVLRHYVPPFRGPFFGPNGEPPDPFEVMLRLKGKRN